MVGLPLAHLVHTPAPRRRKRKRKRRRRRCGHFGAGAPFGTRRMAPTAAERASSSSVGSSAGRVRRHRPGMRASNAGLGCARVGGGEWLRGSTAAAGGGGPQALAPRPAAAAGSPRHLMPDLEIRTVSTPPGTNFRSEGTQTARALNELARAASKFLANSVSLVAARPHTPWPRPADVARRGAAAGRV